MAVLVVTTLGPTVSTARSGHRTFTLIERNNEEQFHAVDNTPRSPHRLHGGALAVEVRFDPSKSPTIAITGGTGKYAGASGTITQVEQRNGSRQTVEVVTP